MPNVLYLQEVFNRSSGPHLNCNLPLKASRKFRNIIPEYGLTQTQNRMKIIQQNRVNISYKPTPLNLNV